jgi:lipopolysaccharide/colanic/teichoic acid biosynthesis glycosyltransferase
VIGYRGKRLLDLIVAVPALVVLSPLLAAIGVTIAWRQSGPVVFRQRRPGLHDRPFTMLKFCTMDQQTDADGLLLPDRERLTALGAFLRRTSLDELPQLVNVVRGDMSVVGPRPLFESYLPYYTERERVRSRVRPGITGLSQVNGRNYLPWDERLEMDAWYVDHCSLSVDLRILGRTLVAVISRRHVAPDSTAVEPNLADVRTGGGES